ncbi:MAG: transcription termination/antitermination protein NusG [Acidobacteriota bacterium]
MLVAPTDPRLLWLVLRTKPKQERTVLEVLAGRDIEAYCPRVIEPRAFARAPHGPVPLFPSYVFSRCVPAERFAAANYCPGAAGILRFGGSIAVVEDEFIAMLREREGERGYLVIGEARRRPVAGERVRIAKGPLAGLEGIVEKYMPAKDRVRLLLALVGGTRRAEVEAAHLTRAR